jgi:cation transport ATPase
VDVVGAVPGLLVAGGCERPGQERGAVREKSLDVDLLMIVAAIAAVAIGQVLGGGLLIVIFATSGALETVATQRTADSVKGPAGPRARVGHLATGRRSRRAGGHR